MRPKPRLNKLLTDSRRDHIVAFADPAAIGDFSSPTPSEPMIQRSDSTARLDILGFTQEHDVGMNTAACVA